MLVVTGIMVGVTYVHGFSFFFFMSIMLRVEDGSFGFGAEGWTVLLFSSFFFFWFSSFILSLFSPPFFHKFHSYFQGMKLGHGSLPSMNLGS